MNHLRPAVTLLVLFTLLTGVAYPLAMTGVAQGLFPAQADGSLIERDGKVIGSELIAQAFAGEKYFHPRPSGAGAGYDAASSSGSNYGPTSRTLMDAIAERRTAAQAQNPTLPVPVELITASGSGLDPHLSPAAAAFQIPRIAQARGLGIEQVGTLVAAHTQGRQFGLLGEPRINVLKLNLALDAMPTADEPPVAAASSAQ